MPSGKSRRGTGLRVDAAASPISQSPREASTCAATPPTKTVPSAAHGSTVQDLVKGILEVQKARMTLQLALFAGAVSLTAAAFQLKNAALLLVAGAVSPLALLSDLITKRNTLSPLLYKLALLELDAGDAEPFALLFVAYDRKGFDRFRSLLTRSADGESRQLFRRHFLRRDLPFRLLFYGGILFVELLLAYVYWGMRPAP
jgi:hypothetical protein